jgi:GntR family transcriptional regulator, rspAB operon transcriptional repressor
VVTLDLPPGTRLSEADVARQMGVSRQPVRDAFYRLSQLGFLQIRPQRPTTVARISEAAVHQARFIRTALEAATTEEAVERLTAGGAAELDAMLEDQRVAVQAGDKMRFHALDDEFHRTICRLSGHEYAWTLIRDNKAHMDRVRYLSLSFGAEDALRDHERILGALKARDAGAAVDRMRVHLSRIEAILAQIRGEHGDYFEERGT